MQMLNLSSSYYLSSIDNIIPSYLDSFGFIQHIHQGGIYRGIKSGGLWILDNAAYSNKFDKNVWIKRLNDYLPYQNACIGIVVPDKVADYKTTLELFRQYSNIPREMGYRIAFVTQDGLLIGKIPWNCFDTLFVGGTNQHKLKESMPIILEAIERKKWVHIGRVNSIARMMQFWIANSWDGTELSFNPSRGSRNMGRAVRLIRMMKLQQKLI